MDPIDLLRTVQADLAQFLDEQLNYEALEGTPVPIHACRECYCRALGGIYQAISSIVEGRRLLLALRADPRWAEQPEVSQVPPGPQN